MKLLFNVLYQSVPSLDVEVIMRLETTQLQDDLLDDGADCVIALFPLPQKSTFQVPSNPPADCGHLYCTYSTKKVTIN